MVDERTMNRVRRRLALEGSCLVFTGSRHPKGYGRISRREPGSNFVHRVVWEYWNGPIPDGMLICHHCDNPPCVLLSHLFLAPPAGNTADMMRKGRNNPCRGEKSGMSKLSREQVDWIHGQRRSGATNAAIARQLGIHESHVSRICSGKRWPHRVPDNHPRIALLEGWKVSRYA